MPQRGLFAHGKSVLILGLGETGLSMVRYLSAAGARLRVADSRINPPGADEVAPYVSADQRFFGPFHDSLFADITLIAISPGVPLTDPKVTAAIKSGIPVVGDIEIFAQQLTQQQPVPRVIAITGSNGKTTVTSLVAHLCRACGVDAVAAGNISPAVLDVILQRGEKQPAVWVLELSSFQLETTHSLSADAASILNISEDHLDRYQGMDEYAAAKRKIVDNCRIQVLNRDDARCLSLKNPNTPTISFGLNQATGDNDFGIEQDNGIWLMQGTQRLIKADQLQLSGLHNVANVLAALALCRSIDLPMPAMLDGLRSFKGLAHRVEKICQLHGITFYDDSKGTNVGATVAALDGLGCKTVLIAGGMGKDQDFSPLMAPVARHARAVVLIGRDAVAIAAALVDCKVPLLYAGDMADAVQKAANAAHTGDAVLLSPACASFDMYRNYVHRAEVFIEEVKKWGDTWYPS
jgi:UDP-N-acetylmuramoylalanine--D-glutamate ligase